MKKFLVFLVSLVIAVSIGLTTYYFLRNDEVISFATHNINCNVGDIINLVDLGKKVYKANKKTTYNYNAASSDVQAYISYDKTKGYYTVKQGGDVQIIITTSNKNCPEFKITVHIGDGTEEHPYFVRSENDLNKIGSTYSLDGYYNLTNDISLNTFDTPIGSTESGVEEFEGVFNGNGYSIKNLTISNEFDHAGLFASLGSTANVNNLYLENVNISGNFNYVGALAGESKGDITKVVAKDVTIINSKTNSVTGGLIGKINSQAKTQMCGVDASLKIGSSDNINATAGGFAGVVDQTKIQACYANTNIQVLNANGNLAGFVGKFVISKDEGSIQESYSSLESENSLVASFIGEIEKTGSFEYLSSMRYINYLVGNRTVLNSHSAVKVYDENFFKSFYDSSKSIYAVVGYNSKEEFVSDNNYIFYAIDEKEVTLWDKCWNINEDLPSLNFDYSTLSGVDGDYFRSHMMYVETISTAEDFISYIESCLENDGKIKDKNIRIETENLEIDLKDYNWKSIEIENSTFDGNGCIIKNLKINNTDVDGNAGFFSVVNNSSVRNIEFKNVTVETDAKRAGVVAGFVTSADDSSSKIYSVKVGEVAVKDNVIQLFGAIAGEANNSTSIHSSNVTNVVLSDDSQIEIIGGAVAKINNSKVQTIEINESKLFASKVVGGVIGVSENNSSVNNVKLSNNEILYNCGQNIEEDIVAVGGVVGLNSSEIYNITANNEIKVLKTHSVLNVGGVVGYNNLNGNIYNTEINGNQISVENVFSDKAYVGGLVGVNYGAVKDSKCLINELNCYIENKEIYVGGISAKLLDSANVYRCVVSSKLYGNLVSGVAVEINGEKVLVDQVLVAKYNVETKEISSTFIKGSNYVAGVAYNFVTGTVQNVQVVAEVYGIKNATVSSIIVLKFESAAVLKNSTFDVALNGNGKFYKETWTDCNTVSSGYANYNLYRTPGCAGAMTSVVINTETASKYGVNFTSSSFAFGFFHYENGYKQKSFFKDVNGKDFSNAASFEGNFTVDAGNTWLFFPQKFTNSLTFNFESAWVKGNGINLAFVK